MHKAWEAAPSPAIAQIKWHAACHLQKLYYLGDSKHVRRWDEGGIEAYITRTFVIQGLSHKPKAKLALKLVRQVKKHEKFGHLCLCYTVIGPVAPNTAVRAFCCTKTPKVPVWCDRHRLTTPIALKHVRQGIRCTFSTFVFYFIFTQNLFVLNVSYLLIESKQFVSPYYWKKKRHLQ